VLVPAPWTAVTFWQYGTPVLGAEYGCQSAEIDMNYFNGSAEEFAIRYGGAESAPEPPPTEPPPTGGTMTPTTYQGGVKTLNERIYESDVQIVIVPNTAIRAAQYMLAPTTLGDLAQNIPGHIVWNATPFANGRPNLGLRISNRSITPYVEFNPFAGWATDKTLTIGHRQPSFEALSNVSQGWRYIIELGVKNARWDDTLNSRAAWDAIVPRQIIAKTTAGYTVLLSVKGRDPENRGATLHEIATILLTHPVFATNRIVMAVDMDGGYSMQTVYRVDQQSRIFANTRQDKVLVFGVIWLNTELTSTEPTPEPPPPAPDPTPEPPPPAGTTREFIETKTLIEPDGTRWAGEAHFILTRQP
jgi:hypothetical protein